jgi:hypothetical protein
MMRGTHRQALQPFLERAGRGAPEVCSRGDAGTLGAGGCSCGAGCVIPFLAHSPAMRVENRGVGWSRVDWEGVEWNGGGWGARFAGRSTARVRVRKARAGHGCCHEPPAIHSHLVLVYLFIRCALGYYLTW